jgi:hypothetical protein
MAILDGPLLFQLTGCHYGVMLLPLPPGLGRMSIGCHLAACGSLPLHHAISNPPTAEAVGRRVLGWSIWGSQERPASHMHRLRTPCDQHGVCAPIPSFVPPKQSILGMPPIVGLTSMRQPRSKGRRRVGGTCSRAPQPQTQHKASDPLRCAPAAGRPARWARLRSSAGAAAGQRAGSSWGQDTGAGT